MYNSADLLQSLIKRSHYNYLWTYLNKLMIIVGFTSSTIGTIYILIFRLNIPLLIANSCFLLCMLVTFILWKRNMICRARLSLIMATYTYFIMTPVIWLFGGSFSESAPYIAILIVIINLIMLSGRIQKVYGACYLALILGLATHSCLTHDKIGLSFDIMIIRQSSFIMVILLIALIIRFVMKRYDDIISGIIENYLKDELTGMMGRKVLDIVIEYMELQYIKQDTDYSLTMIDIDKFKLFNDKYGHMAGDIMLRNIAAIIMKNVDSMDFVIRYGGDEIIIIFHYTTINKAKRIIDKIQKDIKSLSLPDFEVSFSYGTVLRSECVSSEELIQMADKIMYGEKVNYGKVIN